MKILKVGIKNLNSLREETIIDFTANPLNSSGLFAIVGDTGAGKTTILDAITLALYKKTARGREDEVMTFGTTDCYAEVEYEVRGKRYRSRYTRRRSRDKVDGALQAPKMEIALLVDGDEEGQILASTLREVAEKVATITKLDYEQFTRSVMLAQGDFAAFLSAKADKRGELLEQITGTQIYGDLSKAAHIKERTEKQILSNIDAQLSGYQLLSSDDIKEKKEALSVLKKEEKTTKKEVDTLQQQLDWLKKVAELTARKTSLANALSAIKTEKNKLQSDFKKLELHEKTAPFRADLKRLADRALAVKELTDNRIAYATKLTDLQRKAIAIQTELKEVETAEKTLKNSQATEEKTWRKVEALDTKIEGQKTPLQALQKEVKEQANELAEIRQKQSQKTQQLNTFSTTLSEAASWLKTNANLAQVEQDMPRIDAVCEEIEKGHHALKAVRINKETQAQKKAEISRIYQEKKVALKAAQKSLQQTENQYLAQIPEAYPQGRSELLERLHQDIEKLGEGSLKLARLQEWSDAYDGILEHLNDRKEAIEKLANYRDQMDMQYLNLHEDWEDFKQRIEKLKKIHLQQIFLKNYEEDRKRLAKGEACPLCGSKEHPFCNEDVLPFVDEAKNDLDAAEARNERIFQQMKNYAEEVRTVQQQIQNFYGSPENDGELRQSERQLQELEQKIAQLAPGFEFGSFSEARKGHLAEQIALVQENLKKRKKERAVLTQLSGELEALERTVKTLTNEFNEVKITLQVAENQLDNYSKILKEGEQNYNKIMANLTTLLATYDLTLGKGVVEKLRQTGIAFKAKKEQQTELAQQIALLQSEQKGQAKALAKAEKQYEKIAANLAKAEANLATLVEERTLLFGDKKVEKERKNWQAKLAHIEQQLTDLRTQAKTALATQKDAEGRLKTTEEQLKKSQAVEHEQRQKLIEKSTAAGFENLELLQAALLSDTIAEGIAAARKALHEKELKTQQLVQENSSNLETTTALALTTQAADILQVTHAEKDSQRQQLLQQIGGINAQLEANKERQQSQEKLLTSKENQQKEWMRWELLRQVIGSGDGKKYRSFAQGLTLQKLVQLANQHLAKLDGRYIIQKKEKSDLDLQIIDTFQADNLRSMNTLSGGESFLVSLALALGLSDLAGGSAHIRSLFIDEGFGTLDESTLDDAISTLELLQTSGKTIGVISHVKALKERIHTQIRVVKKGSGFSAVEIV